MFAREKSNENACHYPLEKQQLQFYLLFLLVHKQTPDLLYLQYTYVEQEFGWSLDLLAWLYFPVSACKYLQLTMWLV